MSEPILISEEYIFVIDTNEFTGEFVDHLTAYCTGFCAENYEERKFIELFDEQFREQENIFENSIIDQELEDMMSPCSIWLSRTWGVDNDENYAKLTEENYGDYSFPAPFSIGIFFGQEPTQEQIDLIKSRSKEFFEKFWNGVVVEGYRLIKHTKYAEEKNLE